MHKEVLSLPDPVPVADVKVLSRDVCDDLILTQGFAETSDSLSAIGNRCYPLPTLIR